MQRKVWTLDKRIALFKFLKDRFGPLSAWPGSSPVEGATNLLNFCNHFAGLVKAKSGRAVLNQVRWAVTSQPSVKNISTFFECKAAALDAGFITSKEMPTKVECKY
jgi:hypothetical protein